MTSKYESKINDIEKKVNEMDKQSALISQTIENFNNSINKLFETLDNLNITLSGIEKSMISMQSEISKNTADVKDLKTKVEGLDNRGKFDFIVWLKTVALPVIVSGGLVYLVMKIVESLPK